MILVVPVAACKVFAPRLATAEAPTVTVTASDELAAYGVRPAAPAVSADAHAEAKPTDASTVVQLQNWEYTRHRPSINPPP
jgi:hypothetical protein